MGKIAVAVMIVSLAQCNLFFPTQVSFQNNTSAYTFVAIKLGSIDYETALTPGQQSPYISLDPGSYYLYTKGTNGILYQNGRQSSQLQGDSVIRSYFRKTPRQTASFIPRTFPLRSSRDRAALDFTEAPL